MSGFPKNTPRKLKPIPPMPVGRPDYVPTKEERSVVWLAASVGIPHDRIASHLNGGNGIAKMTLEKHFRKELNEGMWEANMEVLGTLFDTIRSSRDPKIKQRAIEFWMERRMQEYFASTAVQTNEPNKLVITVEGGLPKIEHGGLPKIEHAGYNGNGIDIEHANSEVKD
jgi:hypothetical protein